MASKPTNSRRRNTANRRDQRQSVRPTVEQGVAGFVVYGGYLASPESHEDLLGWERWRVASDILANITIVAASLRFMMNMISRPRWSFEPADDTATAKELAEFMESVIDDMDTSWTRIVRRGMMYKYHGFSVHEWVAKKRPDGKIGFKSLEVRPGHTCQRWDIDDNGSVAGIWQRDPQTGAELYLPRGKLLYLVDDGLTDRPDGMGWFRQVADSAKRIKSLLDLENIGFERDLRGLPVGRAPITQLNSLVEQGKLTRDQADTMINGLRDFAGMQRKTSTSGLILDSKPYDSKTDTGTTPSAQRQWDLELITGDPGSLEEIDRAIKRLQTDIALIMGTDVILTGRDGAGSRALSEDKSRNLYLSANAILTDMRECVDRDIVDSIWALNGFPDEMKPKARTEDVAFQDAKQMAETLADMAQAGAILPPDDPAFDLLRDLMGMEPLDASKMQSMLDAMQGQGATAPGAAPGQKPPAGAAPGAPEGDGQAPPEQGSRGADTRKAMPRPLYVQRKLLNGSELVAWAKRNGIESTLPADEMHVTIAYSESPIDPMAIGQNWSMDAHGGITIPAGGPRVMERFGENGDVIVLSFRSDTLEWRHREIMESGASFRWPKYQPHVTVTIQASPDIDVDQLEPFQGALKFGPELFSTIDDSWKESIVEKWGRFNTGDPFSKAGFDPDQPRDGNGRWADIQGDVSHPNPLNDRERLIGARDTETGVEMWGGLTVRDSRDEWHLSDLRSITRGGGRIAMERLVELADQHGKTITLFAVPLDSPAGLKMSPARLRRWYAGFGFERQGNGDEMIRKPVTQKFDPSQPRAPKGSDIGGRWIDENGDGQGELGLLRTSVNSVDSERYRGQIHNVEDDPAIIEKIDSAFISESALTEQEKAALEWYAQDGFFDLNSELRAGLTGENSLEVEQIDRAIATERTTREMTVYRGLTADVTEIDDLPVGTVIEDRGFISTSALSSIAGNFAGDSSDPYDFPVLMRITVPAGKTALHMHPERAELRAYEGEVILPRKSRVRILSRPTNQDIVVNDETYSMKVVDVELI